MLHPLETVSLGYFAPDRTIPSPNFDFLIFLIIILGGQGVTDVMLGKAGHKDVNSLTVTVDS